MSGGGRKAGRLASPRSTTAAQPANDGGALDYSNFDYVPRKSVPVTALLPPDTPPSGRVYDIVDRVSDPATGYPVYILATLSDEDHDASACSPSSNALSTRSESLSADGDNRSRTSTNPRRPQSTGGARHESLEAQSLSPKPLSQPWADGTPLAGKIVRVPLLAIDRFVSALQLEEFENDRFKRRTDDELLYRRRRQPSRFSEDVRPEVRTGTSKGIHTVRPRKRRRLINPIVLVENSASPVSSAGAGDDVLARRNVSTTQIRASSAQRKYEPSVKSPSQSPLAYRPTVRKSPARASRFKERPAADDFCASDGAQTGNRHREKPVGRVQHETIPSSSIASTASPLPDDARAQMRTKEKPDRSSREHSDGFAESASPSMSPVGSQHPPLPASIPIAAAVLPSEQTGDRPLNNQVEHEAYRIPRRLTPGVGATGKALTALQLGATRLRAVHHPSDTRNKPSLGVALQHSASRSASHLKQQQIIEDSSDEDDSELYEVSHIIEHMVVNGQTFFLVAWLGYPEEEATWLKAAELDGAKETLMDYLRAEGLDGARLSPHDNGCEREEIESR